MYFPFVGTSFNNREAQAALSEKSVLLHSMEDLDPLIEKIGNARIVMLGEASHGTHEYYTHRSYISKKLIAQKQFNFIAVEGDWPDCFKINHYIKSASAPGNDILNILKQFNRWPTWMWANWEIAAIAESLQQYNQPLESKHKIGFYGLDVYSLWESLNSIIKYLSKADPAALATAQQAFRCFEPYKEEDGSTYAFASRLVPERCENEVVALLNAIRQKIQHDDSGEEAIFSLEQNALVALNAEKYYRAMLGGNAESWNVRDSHMMETLDRLLEFHGPQSKAIIWAHNTHIGDASATDMKRNGMYNIGQLARERYPDQTALVGFGSYQGKVIAANSWGAPMREMDVPPAKEKSWEALLHSVHAADQLLWMEDLYSSLFIENSLGHRAIGVVYNPEHERYGNYVASNLPQRYDAFVYLDQTKALHPLQLRPDSHKMPETYPFGM